MVTTEFGIEGMTHGMAPGGIVAHTAAAIAQAAVHLHGDEIEWQQHAQQAVTIINKLYSSAATMVPVIDRIAKLINNLESSRMANFTGQMLWQQGSRSTEYFSRWIECKNK